MEKKLMRTMAMFLAAIMIFGAMPITRTRVYAQNRESFSDVPNSHWAWSIIERWAGEGYGVLHGNGDGTFSPDRGLTLAELASILSNSFGYIDQAQVEVTPGWATTQVGRAVAAGVIEEAPWIDASVTISREQAVRYIARAYGVAPVAGNTSFADDASIGAAYRAYVNAFQRMGYVRGRGNNIFDPQASYTRAEAMAVLNNMTSEITDQSLSERVFARSVIVRSPGVSITDTAIGGNLHIGHGVGYGEVRLENVMIGGYSTRKCQGHCLRVY